MGWTSYNASYYKNGKVDRKAECDNIITDDCFAVLKSSMVGTVYYAAVESIKKREKSADGTEKYVEVPKSQRVVFAVIMLTSVNENDYYNFSYKLMDETVMPYCFDCPKSILALLTEPKCEYARKWREKCYVRIEEKKKRKALLKRLNEFEIGTLIKFEYNSEEVTLIKHAPNNQFKKPFWKYYDRPYYMRPSNIPENYKVV